MVATNVAQTGSEVRSPEVMQDGHVEAIGSPPTAPLNDEDIPGFLDRRPFSPEDQRVFDKIMAAWTAHLRPLLGMASELVRERFIAEVLRAGTAPGTAVE